MKNKYIFVTVLLVVLLAAVAAVSALCVRWQAHGEERGEEASLTVVTSFYPMYIAAENVIGDCDSIRLENLSEPQTGCLHDYQLTTEDMALLSTADVFVVNGGGLESFLTEVAEQDSDLTILDACEGITLLDDNAHAWMNVENYMRQVQNICDGLIAALPKADGGDASDTAESPAAAADTAEESDIAAQLQQNTAAYLAQLEELAAECDNLAADLAGQPVVLFHEAYAYLAEELGLTVVGEMDLDEERQVSAGEVAGILSVIEADHVPVIFAEELYAKDMGDRMEEETDVTVLYLDPLTRGDYSADSYVNGMRGNLAIIAEAYD